MTKLKPYSPEWHSALDKMALREELEHRIECMAVTGDVELEDRELTALEDIVATSADDHGAYLPAEKDHWNGIRREARARLRVLCDARDLILAMLEDT